MTSDHKKPGVASWATVVVVLVLVAYPLSFGPACWIMSRMGTPEPVDDALSCFYYPLFRCAEDGPAWLQVPLMWWMELGQAMPDLPTPVKEVRRVTTREIVEMTQAGVSDAVICHVILTRGGRFDTSPDTIGALREAGVSDAVIAAMRKATPPHASQDE